MGGLGEPEAVLRIFDHLIVLLLSMMASAQEPERNGRRPPGSLLWEDRVDQSLFEQAFSLAAGKGRLFVAGCCVRHGGEDEASSGRPAINDVPHVVPA